MSNYSVTTYTEGETESKFDEANRKYYQTLPTSSSNNTNDYGIDDGRTLVHRSHLSTNTKTVIDNGYNPTAPSYREFDIVRTASAILKDTDRILSIYTMLASIIKNRVAVLERNRSISLCDFSKIKYYNEGSLIAIEIYDLDKFTGGILDILRESFGNAVDVEIYTSDTERKEPEIVFDLSKPILPREKVSSGKKIDRSRWRPPYRICPLRMDRAPHCNCVRRDTKSCPYIEADGADRNGYLLPAMRSASAAPWLRPGGEFRISGEQSSYRCA